MPWLFYIRNHKGEAVYLVEALEEELNKMIKVRWR